MFRRPHDNVVGMTLAMKITVINLNAFEILIAPSHEIKLMWGPRTADSNDVEWAGS